MSSLLSDEKQTHLSHIILRCLQEADQAVVVGDPTFALREIKHVLSEHTRLEQEIDRLVRARLHSYSRPIPEGSQEWDVMYQKIYAEELRKRKLG